MSDTKFTCGEWIADIRVGCCAVYSKDSRDECEQGLHNDSENIYYASFPNVTMNPELKSQSIEPIANAHLIAAAPEMYEMLEKLYDESRLVYVEDYDLVEDLLAKARGEL